MDLLDLKDYFYHYIINRYNGIPDYIYECFLSFLCIGIISLLLIFGLKKGSRLFSLLLLLEYLILFFLSTIFCRDFNEGQGYNFTPFWSYIALQNCKKDFIVQIIMNVVAFIPVGILLGCSFYRMRWWKALLIGCGLSIATEILQFMFKLGFAETDDVIHNSTGCLIGFVIYKILYGLGKQLKIVCGGKYSRAS